MLDRVVAVVNNRAILLSDVEDDIRLSVRICLRGGQGPLTEQHALEEPISRTLIEQPTRQEDLQAIEPSQQEVDSRLEDLRKQLPACIRQNCASDAGWKAFLASHDLTADASRLTPATALKSCASSSRIRQGIQISQQQIEDYYHNTLLPQYAPGEAVPSLDQVASQIQEILLQQQVNVDRYWLDSLRQQAVVEVLDPKLAPALDDCLRPSANREGVIRERS